jgi:hypothetical protein
MIEQFRERNFILSLYGANIYGFVHRAFLEYFCATSFVHQFEKSRELTPENLNTQVYGAHWQDQTWHEVLRLIAGMIDEKFADGVIEYLVASANPKWSGELDEKNLPWNIALAVQCLAEIRNTSPLVRSSGNLLRAIVQFLATSAEKAPYSSGGPRFIKQQILPSVRVIGEKWPDRSLLTDLLLIPDLFSMAKFGWAYIYEFAELVSLLREERTLEVIKSFARNANPYYRVWTSQALAWTWPEDKMTRQLLRQLVRDEDEDVRWTSFRALIEHFDDAQTGLLLTKSLLTDPSSLNRSSFLGSLQLTDAHPENEVAIKDRAVNDSEAVVRLHAIEKLADSYQKNGKDEALQGLLNDVKEDRDESVRDLVAKLSKEKQTIGE